MAWLLEAKAADNRRWTRAAGTSAAVTAVIAEYASGAGKDELIARELEATNATHGPECALTGAAVLQNLQSGHGLQCRAVHAVSPMTYWWRWRASVAVDVSPTLWADRAVREVVMGLLADRGRLCRYVTKYAPNNDLEAHAIGCGRDRALSIVVNVRQSPFPRCRLVPHEGGGVRNSCTAPTPILESIAVDG
jgi:hypothetical protein